MFGIGKPKHHVVTSFSQACDLLARMGVEVAPRASAANSNSVIIRKNGLKWVFAGDTELFTVARVFEAPEGWSIDKLQSWMFAKNFVVVIHNPDEKTFILASHIIIEGGIILQNMARLVYNFDAYIIGFQSHMNLGKQHFKPLE